MELKFLPSLLGAESLWLAMPIAEVLTALYAAYAMKRYTRALPLSTRLKGRRSLSRRPFGILWITSTESRSDPYSRRGSPAADLQ